MGMANNATHATSHGLGEDNKVIVHCVDCIYRDTPSARIDRLIPIWKQPSDSRLHTAASQEKEPPSHSRLHTAVSQGIKGLSDTYLETAV